MHCVRFFTRRRAVRQRIEDGTLRLWQTEVGKTYGLWKCVDLCRMHGTARGQGGRGINQASTTACLSRPLSGISICGSKNPLLDPTWSTTGTLDLPPPLQADTSGLTNTERPDNTLVGILVEYSAGPRICPIQEVIFHQMLQLYIPKSRSH